MKPSEQLRAARALIEDPARWTTEATARDAEGKYTSVFSKNAVCWDAVGAMIKSKAGWYDTRSWDYLAAAAGPYSISIFNDRESHAAALALYDRAIAAAEAQEANDGR